MKDRALDVWADLRDRHLWPVAALLLAALVAVPLVLVKPAEQAPTRAAVPTNATRPGDPLAKQAVVKAFDSKPLVRISRLDQFGSKDPFKPVKQLKPIKSTTGGATPTTGSGSGAKPPSAGGGGGAPGGRSPGGAPAPGGGSPGSAPGPGGSTPSPAQPAPPKKYTYTVDVTFVDGMSTKGHRGFDRLGMLPSETSPLLVFLGVDSTGTKAAFLVDSSLQVEPGGEGSCKPSSASCGVLYLEPGQLQTFKQADGHTYTLRIDQINQVSVEKASVSAWARTTATGAGRPSRRFLFPVLTDLQIGGGP